MTPRTTLAICFVWLAVALWLNPVTHAAPPPEGTLDGDEVLARLVGSWAAAEYKDDPSCIRQECQWVLNRKYLEIQTFVDIKPHPPKTWKTLIAYEPTDNSYRLWRFSDDGVVTTERGTWDSKRKTVSFEGRTSNGRDSSSLLTLFDDKDSMERSVFVDLDEDGDVQSGVAFSLGRVSNTAAKQLTKP
ncbi:MAG: hypothetical protein WAO83_14495 [Fuerstiella sp.]